MNKTLYQLNNSFIKRISAVAFAGLLIVSLMVIVNSEPSAEAAIPGPVLINMQASSITSTSATITWQTDILSNSYVRYGLDATYGSEVSNSSMVTDHALILSGLSAGTQYHYQIASTDEAGDTTTSQNRFFTTAAGTSGDTTAPGVFNISVNAIATSAEVSFITNEDAHAIVYYGPTSSYGSQVTESAGSYTGPHLLTILGLEALHTYHYQIFVEDIAGNSFTSNDFHFTTSGSDTDHTFTTGNCDDGTELGQCNISGQYCSGGTLIFDCGQCGFTCPSGQTCRVGGICIDDPPLSGSAYECNPGTCYDANTNAFNNPAAAGCYASWLRCNANIVMKVRRDRVCDKWLTCETGTKIINRDTGVEEQLCYDLAGCNKIGIDGQCVSYLTEKQCNNDPLVLCNDDQDCPEGGSCVLSARYCYNAINKECVDDNDCSGGYCSDDNSISCLEDNECASGQCIECIGGISNVTYNTPEEVAKIKYLTGSIVAGLDWIMEVTGPYIQGYYPWSVMPQLGGNVRIINASFEDREYQNRCDGNLATLCMENTDCDGNDGKDLCIMTNVYKTAPWSGWAPVIGQEGSVINQWEDGVVESGNRVLKILTSEENFSGASAYFGGVVDISTSYFVTLRMKASIEDAKVLVQFGPGNEPTADYYQTVSTDWQTYTAGPAHGLSSNSFLKVVCYEETTDDPACGTFEIQIDDVAVKPLLEAQTGETYTRIPPSCRLYPRSDSQACEYSDDNGVNYHGWYGYCLEEWPAGSGRCISWWPVDLIKGERNVFGDDLYAGLQVDSPLYYCLESEGNVANYYNILFNDRCWEWQYNNSCNKNGFDFARMQIPYGTVSPWSWTPEEIANISIKPGACMAGAGSDKSATGCGFGDDDWKTIKDWADGWEGISLDLNESNKFFGCWTDSAGFNCNNIDLLNSTWATAENIIYQQNNGLPQDTITCDHCNLAMAKYVSQGGGYRVRIFVVDDSQYMGWFDFDLSIQMKEQCNKIVQVAKPGDNKGWSQRLADGSIYQIPDLNYDYRELQTPFGAVVSPPGNGSPQTWTIGPLNVETMGFIYPDPGQVRAGRPYACVGDCSQRRCLGGKGGSVPCRQSEDCIVYNIMDQPGSGVKNYGVCQGVGNCAGNDDACLRDSDCDPGFACIGGNASNRTEQTIRRIDLQWGRCSNNQTVFCRNDNQCVSPGTCEYDLFAQEHIMRLFAQSYGLWQWNDTLKHYEYVWGSSADESISGIGTPNWYPPKYRCVDGSGDSTKVRPEVDFMTNNDYCAIPPQISNFVIGQNNAKTVVLDGGSGKVEFHFTTIADPQQVPLQFARFDWEGDGEMDSDGIYSLYPLAPKSSLNDPHVVTKAYRCDEGMTPCPADEKNNGCYDDETRTCYFTPKIQVQDNWGWCNNADANVCEESGDPCTGAVYGDCPDYQGLPQNCLTQRCPYDSNQDGVVDSSVGWYPRAAEDIVTIKVRL
ncbi:MAG: fibronectin type III domain-containing protein [Patescibacteria group bacterium]